MGVYHISGLGFRPGALTMPLTAVYILQVAQLYGNEKAEAFFKYSGEAIGKGSYEKIRGKPEALIIFTSREVIEGRKNVIYRSNWFKLSGNKSENIEKPIIQYLKMLVNYINNIFNIKFCIKYFYLVEVNHQDFEDCFEKIGVILRALERKEVWANMIGGTNQINTAMLTAGAYTAVVSRYYYLFQSDVDLMEPEWISKPTNENDLNLATNEILKRWHELPIFNLELGNILRDISNLFVGRNSIHIKEVENILEKYGIKRQFLAKLRGRLLEFKGDKVSKGQMFDKIVGIWNKISEVDVKDKINEWKENKIIREVDVSEIRCS